MAISPLGQAGVAGIQAGVQGVRSAAQEIAELNGPAASESASAGGAAGAPSQAEDGVEALLDLRTQLRQVQASAKAFDTADEAVGFLLDIRA